MVGPGRAGKKEVATRVVGAARASADRQTKKDALREPSREARCLPVRAGSLARPIKVLLGRRRRVGPPVEKRQPLSTRAEPSQAAAQGEVKDTFAGEPEQDATSIFQKEKEEGEQ